jgi:type IV pilus assembly protein PilY1
MRKTNHYRLVCIVCLFVFILWAYQALADDICMFQVTADEVPPNIVILLDNGAEMQQVVWHPDYDNGTDYTPVVSGFLNPNGYGIAEQGGNYYLVEILANLETADYTRGIQAEISSDGARTGTWTINSKTVTLPAEAYTYVDDDGIKDNAGLLRYSKNYLNWIFFSGMYTGDGSDLPHKSRFYIAKQAILAVAKVTSNKASFGIYNFASVEGASSVQPLGMVVDTIAPLPEDNVLDPNFVNNVNNMGTVIYSPLAEGLATVGGYYDSPSSHVVGYYCQKSFMLIVSPGISSYDRHDANQYLPPTLSDYDADGGTIGEGNIQVDSNTYAIPVNLYGTTWLDDVAHYMYTNDMVGYQPGFQNVMTYTIGFMGDHVNNLFLINTSNNGNGNQNLYNSSDPEYGKYHFTAESPDDLTSVLLSAVNSILSQNLTFTAPVVPVTKPMSSNNIYLAFFKPEEGNFWKGWVMKFGINDQLEVVGSDGQAATWPNGAMKEDAIPYWSTKNWADTAAVNGILHSQRDIYTYLGGSRSLIDIANQFKSSNSGLTAEVLGNPTHPTAEIIDYIRGADVYDEDEDSITTENREVITGDVLHSQPLVVQYYYTDGSATTMLYFGANDGMLHAVLDSIDPDVDTDGDEVNYGKEEWAFIPQNQLHRLKDIIEGTGHQYFIDASPKAYIKDVNGNGFLESGDKVILICGERKGGSSYFALDVTDPDTPHLLWRIAPDSTYHTDTVIPELGQTWSEPVIGVVRTSDIDTSGTPVFFIGGGWSSDNTSGKAVIAIDVFSGAVVEKFVNDGLENTDMNFSFTSSVNIVDEDSNGFVDKVYVGDLGGQMWRFGQVTMDAVGGSLTFPECNENIHSWSGQVIFRAPTYVVDAVTYTRKFYYPPSITLEKGFDLVFIGTGDRSSACSPTTAADRIYCVKDTHAATILTEANLVDVTDPAAAAPSLNDATDVDGNGHEDQGWLFRLLDAGGNQVGEKVLARGIVYHKTYYITTFIPSEDPCVPGGDGKLYALDYMTAGAVLTFGGASLVRGEIIGGGIPSNPVPIITPDGEKLFISIGSSVPVDGSDSIEAGVMDFDPLSPANNLYYLWWRELIF